MLLRLFPRFCRVLACLLVLSLLTQVVYPPLVYGLTSGPSQPEFSSFESVSTAEMVNAFSGDFTYNLPVLTVPGPQGSSYPISLSYHSGSSSEEEASWVGYGFSLNPGSVSRNMRGLPDDDKGNTIIYHNKVPKNWTVTALIGGSIESFTFEKKEVNPKGQNDDNPKNDSLLVNLKPQIKASLDLALRYNNYNGLGYNVTRGLSAHLFKGVTNVGLTESCSETGKSYTLNVSPYKFLGTFAFSVHDTPDGVTLSGNYNPYATLHLLAKNKDAQKQQEKQNRIQSITGRGTGLSIGGNHGFGGFAEMHRPMVVTGYNGVSLDVNVALEFNPTTVPVGLEGRLRGSYTEQNARAQTDLRSYGYLYASLPLVEDQQDTEHRNSSMVQDYYTEKETPYIRRDKFLGIGFHNADHFAASGEGMMGGFQLHHKRIGQFYPPYVKSTTTSGNVGADFHVGTNFGAGAGGGVIQATMEETAWDKRAGDDQHTFSPLSEDESVFFRFINDQGGVLDYGTTDAPVAALRTKSLLLPNNGLLPKTLTQRNARSSYIGYTLNKTMLEEPARSYSRRADISAQAQREQNPDRIGEFSIYNTSGMQYIYALPVYNRKEKNLQLGTAKATSVEQNYLAYGIKDDKYNPVKVGQERKHDTLQTYSSAYANAFLLTQITTPDYADVQMNGPDPSDKGGYTLFHYAKWYGQDNRAHPSQSNAWYHWRLPYTGHIYQRGAFSDPMDDRASVSEGEKEIYLLRKIETKTHVAIFRTSEREDGLDAHSEGNQKGQVGSHTLQKLDRIDLYNRADYLSDSLKARPIKSVFFSYDYSLCPQTPNVAARSVTKGKLTLKKIWFEYYGVQQTGGKISPYVFEYNYPNYATYPERYRSLGIGYGFNAQDQNPTFSYFQTDAWGNYQYGGQTRYHQMQSWVNQLPDLTHFDVAAWQLKVIKLPSGGEIHVQYEQDDYAYVQDQPAHVMRNLDAGQDPGIAGQTNTFFIEPQANENPNELRDAIFNYYKNGKNKIYFKFLYRLLGNQTPVQIDDCNAEYISGYADVKEVGVDEATQRVFIRVGSGQNGYELPGQVCRDFVKSNRFGKLNVLRNGGNCNGQGLLDNPSEDNAESLVRKLFSFRNSSVNEAFLCMVLSAKDSYVRVPAIRAKKGGGLRVKRLLTFDKGLSGEAVLYGTEYSYTTIDAKGRVQSSGVATTEPSSMREENVLVGFMPRFGQTNKTIAGVDKKQTEGMLGESILPTASVGYSRVVSKNIHSGKSNPGFSIEEYYTAQTPAPTPVRPPRGSTEPVVSVGKGNPNGSYAFFSDYTPLEEKPLMERLQLPLLFYNKYVNKAWLTQGFSFYLNDMHGKPRRMATYAGNYTQPGDEAKALLVTEQLYEYHQPGADLPVVNPQTGQIEYQKLGQEMDVTYAQKLIRERSEGVQYHFDLTAGFIGFGFLPFLGLLPVYTEITNETYVHTTTKIIRQTCALKRMRSYADGIYHTDEYLAYDPNTGQPVWSKSYDEFGSGQKVLTRSLPQGTRAAYASQTILASWQYPGMAQKYLLEGKVIQPSGITLTYEKDATQNEWLHLSGTATQANLICKELAQFSPGDVLELPAATSGRVYYRTGAADYLTGRVQIYRSRQNTATAAVLNSGTVLPKVTIVHSGRSNELSVPAGSTTYHATTGAFKLNPVGTSSGAEQFAQDLTAKYQAATGENGFITVDQRVYANMNMSAYASRIPAAWKVKLEEATIQKVGFAYVRNANQTISLRLLSFEVKGSDGTFRRVSN